MFRNNYRRQINCQNTRRPLCQEKEKTSTKEKTVDGKGATKRALQPTAGSFTAHATAKPIVKQRPPILPQKHRRSLLCLEGKGNETIARIIRLNGLEVEICGSWIWVSGNTKEHKEVLKQLGFKFAYKKKAWYYHKDKFRKKSHEELTMDDIRDMFGSQRYEQKKEEEKKLQAAI